MYTRIFSLVLASLLLSIATPVNAQLSIFKRKKPTKKELIRELEAAQKELDSLQKVLETDPIPLTDTASLDALNSGRPLFNYDGTDIFEGVEPGSNRDSLLSEWYGQKKLNVEDLITLEPDSVKYTSNIPDSVFIAKIKKMNSIIPIPYNYIVRNEIVRYTEQRKELASRILGLSSYYLPMFKEILDYYGLPQELAVMSIIESALNPIAVSWASAKGIWQFMYATARQYNLQITSYVDERYDPIAATHAAAKYLRDAYTIFGDWALAISSYNCGAGNVNKAIRRAGSKEFWNVYPYLPRETRGYVPAFVGALYLTNYYQEYDIVPTEPYALPAHVDTLIIRKNLHFEQIAANVDISVKELRTLNPQYLHDIIPGNERAYNLRVPYNITIPFIDKEKDIYAYKDSVYFSPIVYNKIKNNVSPSSRGNRITHTVTRGQTLGGIALKYKVSLSNLCKWNGLSTRSTLKIGRKLVVYTNGYKPASSSYKSVTYSADTKVPGASISGGYIWYTVKSGDTLLGIAIKFPGADLNDILRINGYSKKTRIYPGKKIKIRKI